MNHQTDDPAQETSDQPEPDVHSRYATLGGATVVMTTHPDADQCPGCYVWRCGGCQDHAAVPQDEIDTRRSANRHAGQCRAMPPGATA